MTRISQQRPSTNSKASHQESNNNDDDSKGETNVGVGVAKRSSHLSLSEVGDQSSYQLPQHQHQLQEEERQRQQEQPSRARQRSSWRRSLTKRLSFIKLIVKKKKKKKEKSTYNFISEQDLLAPLWQYTISKQRETDHYYVANFKLNILMAPPDGIPCDVDETRILFPTIGLGAATASRRVGRPSANYKLQGPVKNLLLQQIIPSLSSWNRRVDITMTTCDFPNDMGLFQLLKLVNERHLLESLTFSNNGNGCASSNIQQMIPPIVDYLAINPNLVTLNLQLYQGSKCLLGDSNDDMAIQLQNAIAKSKTLRALALNFHPQTRNSVWIESQFVHVMEGIAANTSIEALSLTLYHNNNNNNNNNNNDTGSSSSSETNLVKLLIGHSTIAELQIRGPYKRERSLEDLKVYLDLMESSNCRLDILKLCGQGWKCNHVDAMLSANLWDGHPLQELDVSENSIEKLEFTNYLNLASSSSGEGKEQQQQQHHYAPHPWKVLRAFHNPISTEFYSCQRNSRGSSSMVSSTKEHCVSLIPLIKTYPDLVVDWIDDEGSGFDKILRVSLENVQDQCLLDAHYLKHKIDIDTMPLLAPCLFEKLMDTMPSRNNQTARQANLIYTLWRAHLPHLIEFSTRGVQEDYNDEARISDDTSRQSTRRNDDSQLLSSVCMSYSMWFCGDGVTMAKNSKFAMVRLEKSNSSLCFEIICHWDKLEKYYQQQQLRTRACHENDHNDDKDKEDDHIRISMLLETNRIFANVARAEYVPNKVLLSSFGTNNVVQISKRILAEGDVFALE